MADSLTMQTVDDTYQVWLSRVQAALQSINMPFDDWQSVWRFRVHHCDDEKKLVFGTLDNDPLNDYHGKIGLGTELAISYSQIREHRRA
jgi:hypothetical protein